MVTLNSYLDCIKLITICNEVQTYEDRGGGRGTYAHSGLLGTFMVYVCVREGVCGEHTPRRIHKHFCETTQTLGKDLE